MVNRWFLDVMLLLDSDFEVARASKLSPGLVLRQYVKSPTFSDREVRTGVWFVSGVVCIAPRPTLPPTRGAEALCMLLSARGGSGALGQVRGRLSCPAYMSAAGGEATPPVTGGWDHGG